MKRVIRWSLPAAALLGAILSVRVGAAPEEGRRSVREGVFSERQVARGRKVYEKTCKACHLEDWFTDGTFMASWRGQSVHTLFDVIRRTMPETNPGGLKRREYADVLAFIFSINNLPTGEKDMKSDDKTLKQIVIEQPETSGGGEL